MKLIFIKIATNSNKFFVFALDTSNSEGVPTYKPCSVILAKAENLKEAVGILVEEVHGGVSRLRVGQPQDLDRARLSRLQGTMLINGVQ